MIPSRRLQRSWTLTSAGVAMALALGACLGKGRDLPTEQAPGIDAEPTPVLRGAPCPMVSSRRWQPSPPVRRKPQAEGRPTVVPLDEQPLPMPEIEPVTMSAPD